MKPIMQSIGLKDTPHDELAKVGILHMPNSGSYHLRVGERAPYGDFDRDKIAARARQLQAENKLLILDIEHLDMPAGVDELIEALLAASEAAPAIRIGLYSILPPMKAYGENCRWYITEQAEQFERWMEASEVLFGALRPYVDFAVPSLYTLDRDWFTHKRWELFAQMQFSLCASFDIPCYGALWPEYHRGGNRHLPQRMIEGRRWRDQLEYVYHYADGVWIWNAKSTIQGDTYKPDAPYVTELIDFASKRERGES